MVTLKLKVAPAVFARLFDELKQTSNQLQVIKRIIPEAEFGSYPIREEPVNFVRILPGERKFDSEEMEMILELTQEVPDADEHQGVKPNQKVTREMVGKLFDLLGLFPRSKEVVISEAVVQEITGALQNIRSVLNELGGLSVATVGGKGHLDSIAAISVFCDGIERALVAK